MMFMKKYIIGAVFGFILSIGVSAHAEVVNMIGKVVDGTFAVKVGDNTIDTPAIVIEGTSYLPVRAIGDAIGYTVGFDSDLGITLTPKAVTQQPFKPKTPLPIQDISRVNILGFLKSGSNFLELDGNQYVSLSTLLGDNYKIDLKDQNAIITPKDQPDIVINVSGEYQANIDGFRYQGPAYVKLSVLGLKATVNGDTLIIDKQ